MKLKLFAFLFFTVIGCNANTDLPNRENEALRNELANARQEIATLKNSPDTGPLFDVQRSAVLEKELFVAQREVDRWLSDVESDIPTVGRPAKEGLSDARIKAKEVLNQLEALPWRSLPTNTARIKASIIVHKQRVTELSEERGTRTESEVGMYDDAIARHTRRLAALQQLQEDRN